METTKRETELRLYVWTDFAPDWSSGLAFAIAYDEDDARKQIIEECGIAPTDWGTLQVFPLMQRVAKAVWGGG